MRWALERGEPAIERMLSAELGLLQAEVARGLAAHGDLPADAAPAAHGVLAPGRRALLRQLALCQVVVPCARQLLERVRAERHGQPQLHAATV